jgi:folate-binding protein YgfZ
MGEPTTSDAASDYRTLREKGGAVDLSAWTVLKLRGPDTRAFLQGLATQDLESATPGRPKPTFFLNEKGRPVALAWVEMDEAGSSAWVIADEGARSTLRAHFERFRIMEDVQIDGPEGMPPLIGFAGPDGLSPEVLPQAAPSHFADPASFEAWRLATGIPRTGIDIDLDRIATELIFPEAISLTKGCYVGQEIVARTSNRGQVRRHRVGFRFDWEGRPIPARTELRAGDVAAGYVTSTAPEPGTDQGIGMGYLSVDAQQQQLEVLALEGTTPRRVRPAPWPL